MSVLTEISLFPLDKGVSLSFWIGKAVEHIRNSGVEYRLSAMGTTYETDSTEQAFKIANELFEILLKDSDRVYCTIKIDCNKNKVNALDAKVRSVEDKIGEVKK